jgi:hypothetical protein
MQLSSRPIAAFGELIQTYFTFKNIILDPEGLIFGAGINNDVIKLYDLRSFDKVI